MDVLKKYAAFVWSRYRRHFVLLVGVSLGAGLTEGLTLALLLPLLSTLGLGGGQGFLHDLANGVFSFLGFTPTLEVVLGFIFFVSLCQATLQFARGVIQGWMQNRMTNDRRREIVDSALNAPWQQLSQISPSVIASRLLFESDRLSMSFNYFSQLVSLSILFGFYGLLALAIHPGLSALSLLLMVMGAFGLRRYFNFGRALGAEITDRNKELYAVTTELLQATKLIKTYDRSEQAKKWYGKALDQNARTWRKWFINTNKIRGLIEPTAVFFLCLFLWFAVAWLEVPATTVLLLLFLFLRLLPRAVSLQQAWSDFLAQAPAFESLEELRQRLSRSDAFSEGGQQIARDGTFDLRNVSYKASDGATLLNRVDLKIHSGEFVVLTGPSGAGKSTIVDLVLGLLSPTTGQVQLGGLSRSEVNLRSWIQKIGYVPQDTFIFEGTLRENLLWGSDSCSEDDLWEVLQSVGLADEVRHLPEGLDCSLGAEGVRLSGGQRQRLSLARALLRRPLLLILDEATSQLDADNELLILRVLARLKGRVGILAIAHREAFLKSADRVISVARGETLQN